MGLPARHDPYGRGCPERVVTGAAIADQSDDRGTFSCHCAGDRQRPVGWRLVAGGRSAGAFAARYLHVIHKGVSQVAVAIRQPRLDGGGNVTPLLLRSSVRRDGSHSSIRRPVVFFYVVSAFGGSLLTTCPSRMTRKTWSSRPTSSSGLP